jgi:hypothetical protein
MLARGHEIGQQPPLPGTSHGHRASLMQTILILNTRRHTAAVQPSRA